LTILPHDDPRSFDIVQRLQRIIDASEERELDGTEVRVMRDAIYEIKRLRNIILKYDDDISFDEFIERHQDW